MFDIGDRVRFRTFDEIEDKFKTIKVSTYGEIVVAEIPYGSSMFYANKETYRTDDDVEEGVVVKHRTMPNGARTCVVKKLSTEDRYETIPELLILVNDTDEYEINTILI